MWAWLEGKVGLFILCICYTQPLTHAFSVLLSHTISYTLRRVDTHTHTGTLYLETALALYCPSLVNNKDKICISVYQCLAAIRQTAYV